MACLRWVLLFALAVPASLAATFGTVVPVVGGLLDIVLDEPRNRLYLVNPSPSLSRIEVYSIPQRRFLNPIPTDTQPISAALSPSGKFLYVTSYDGSSLNVIDLDTMAVVKRVSLPAKPEGAAAGGDGRVLITTIGTGPGNSANTLLIYDPEAVETKAVSNVMIAPPPPTPPQLPPPQGKLALASRSRLIATPDGRYIIGLTNINSSTGVAFVYEVASGSVLRSRTVGNASTVLSVSPDGSRFMAGLTLFDTETLSILAQQNAANAPFPFQSGANFSLTQNVGGSVFSPDGNYLLSAFNIPPMQNPPPRPNASELLISDPDNLLVHLALQLPENIAGKMVISSDGRNVYALSESGFMILPLGNMQQNPIAMPETTVVLLANDQCGVTAGSRSVKTAIRNMGRGRMSLSAQLWQSSSIPGLVPGGPGGGTPGGQIIVIPPPTQPGRPGQGDSGVQLPPAGPGVQPQVLQSAPQVRVNQAEQTLEFTFNPGAARSPGTIAPHNFVIQSPEAINIPPRIRVYQNNRDAEARAGIIPVEVGISDQEGLVDMVADPQRRRLYIANSGKNRVEVFDMRTREFLAPIKVGQLPRSLALTPDGNTLYVANTGGESISIVDLNQGKVVGRVRFPPTPFNASAGAVTPGVIAAGLSGLQVVMNDGTLWQVIGNEALPRPVSPVIGTNRVQSPRTMAATPNGEYIILVAGANANVYLYDAMVDEYVMSRQLSPTPVTGFIGPVAAGPRGQYYVVNGTVLNQSLTPVASAPGVQVPGRAGQPSNAPLPVAAVAPAGTTTYARFIQPVRTSASQLSTEVPTVEIVDVNSGNPLRSAAALEGPLSTVVGAGRAYIDGRTMAVDPAGNLVYVLTTSGLSIVPLDEPARLERPAVNRNGVVNMASYTAAVAPGGLISLFGQNLGAEEMAGTTPLPTILGGTCITVNNRPLPLIMTSPQQVNAQIPPELAAGRYTLVVRSLTGKIASLPYQLTVSKFAPAVFVDPVTNQPAIFHDDGRPVTKDSPAKRDRRLVIYATGLGPTKGGKVTAGVPAPAEPLAVTEPVKVFFGDPTWRQAEMIVEWSGLAPGFIGLNQINIRVPGERIKGDGLLVTVRVGGVESPKAGPVVPSISVD